MMSVLHLLDLSTLSAQQVYCFLALEQKVNLLGSEDSPHGNRNVCH